MVEDDSGGGWRRRQAVEQKRSQQPALQHAEPSRNRHQVGQVPDLVAEHHRHDRGVHAERPQTRPQHRDVEHQIPDSAEKPPVGRERHLLGVANPARRAGERGAGPALLARRLGLA